MVARRVFYPGIIPSPPSRVQVQAAKITLLHVRLLLLLERPQFLVPLGLPFQRNFMDSVLLPVAWIPGHRYYYLERQYGVP